MLFVARKLLLSLGMASLLIGCRSEFGYNNAKEKSPARSPSKVDFRISADKPTVNVKGYGNSVVTLTAYCQLSGTKVIDWEITANDRKRGNSVTHEFLEAKAHTVKAYCRNGSKTLTATAVINAVIPGQGNAGQYPGQYPGAGKDDGKGGQTNPTYDNDPLPQQPTWEQGKSYPNYGGGYKGGTSTYPTQYPSQY